jgi:hypothetical protein
MSLLYRPRPGVALSHWRTSLLVLQSSHHTSGWASGSGCASWPIPQLFSFKAQKRSYVPPTSSSAHPQILVVSLSITVLSLFLRSAPPPTSFARTLHGLISTRLSLTKPTSDALWSLVSKLPRQIFPILLLLRLPLLIIALQQQVFQRPSAPYLAAKGQLQILSSARGVTGQVVVGEELTRGFRFLRCDASILGGRWVRTTAGSRGGASRKDLGDSSVPSIVEQWRD